MRVPRLMIAAPKSGSGKTIITCGILSFLKERGTDVMSYKCGPDYIDPMFHRKVIGVPGRNLDTFFSGPEEIRSAIAGTGHEAAVIEGVMGIYDGIAGAGKAVTGGPGSFMTGSCYDVAAVTRTPAVLVADVKGMGATMLAVIRGILMYDTANLIRGVILNRISAHYLESAAPLVREMLAEVSAERGACVRLLGGLPDSPDIHLSSRHLGLMMPDEVADLKKQVAEARKLIEEHLDTDMLLEIMSSAPELPDATAKKRGGSQENNTAAGTDGERPSADRTVTLAVARDEAFCFYYEENLDLLARNGIRIKEFSPLHDSFLPHGADGILLGGGYPELYAEELSANGPMLESIRSAIASGMPSLAECGGFMMLMDELTDREGMTYSMAGVIHGKTYYAGKLTRFGYITVSGRPADGCGPDGSVTDTLLSGLSVRGHEFHYFDSTDNGNDAVAVKPGNGRSWGCIHAGEDHVWGYPHLWYPSCPELIDRFRAAMERYSGEKGDTDR